MKRREIGSEEDCSGTELVQYRVQWRIMLLVVLASGFFLRNDNFMYSHTNRPQKNYYRVCTPINHMSVYSQLLFLE
jgi:hypothetical protein